MGHLYIVSLETLDVTNLYISVTGKIGGDNEKSRPQIEKTLADIFSDALCTREGDYVFPWIIKGEKTQNIGFKYLFKISGKPIFVKGSNYPVKIPLSPTYIEFENPLREAEALDIFREKLLWNAIGKKSLGRGKSITHQTLEEDDLLIKLLGESSIKVVRNALHYSRFRNITIDLNQNEDKLNSFSVLRKQGIWQYSNKDRIKNIDIEKIQWVDGNKVKAEKVLEAWIMEHITDRNNPLDLIFPNNYEIIWFGNYLPYGVSGNNIDIVVIYKCENTEYASVIELKREGLNEKKWSDTFIEVIRYSEFISRALFKGNIKNVKPVIISHISGKPSLEIKNKAKKMKPKEITLVNYDIQNGKISFNKF